MRIFLETGHLTLRQFTEDDVDNLFDLNSDPEVMRYVNGGKGTPREEIQDEIIPFHLGVYQRFEGFGTWAADARSGGISSAGSISGRSRARASILDTGCAGPYGTTAMPRRDPVP